MLGAEYRLFSSGVRSPQKWFSDLKALERHRNEESRLPRQELQPHEQEQSYPKQGIPIGSF